MARRRVRFRFIALVLAVVLCAVAYVTVIKPWSMRQKYVIRYPEMILEHTGAYEVDPYLVLAMIYCESTFNPNALSRVGARGLMQIMPDTGEWLAKKIDLSPYEAEMLYDPDVSIQMGCWYISYLIGRYKGDVTCSVAAYHAGQGTIDKWLADPAISTDGKTLTNFPQNETSKYTGRVLSVYEIYKELYPDGISAQ